ncbi:hypothetical protein WME75_33690 [Sorangium sp. So ce1014]|uniref:hypothetical protein n=1 Tax=Sorangium sp. So ce1014 TaxID=3133326 RepID=UPI003F5F39CC
MILWTRALTCGCAVIGALASACSGTEPSAAAASGAAGDGGEDGGDGAGSAGDGGAGSAGGGGAGSAGGGGAESAGGGGAESAGAGGTESAGDGGAESAGGAGGEAGGAGCPPGEEGCPCGSLDRCDGELRCVDGVCIAGCACTDGYAMVDGECVWQGGPLDPSFQSADTWSTTGAALVHPEAEGNGNPGAGVIGRDAVCQMAGFTQQLTMPDLACAEPLLLTFAARIGCDAAMDCLGPPGVGVRINGGFSNLDLMPSSSFAPQRVCLGERAYGGPVELLFGPSRRSPLCDEAAGQGYTLAFDDVAIRPDEMSECPLPGQVLNGDFEGGAAGWTATPENGVSGIVSGLGQGGGKGGQLATTLFCQYPSLEGAVSAPLPSAALPNPALRIWSQGSPGAVLNVTLSTHQLTALTGTGEAQVAHVCLPRWALGMAHRLAFTYRNRNSQPCTAENKRDFTVDDLAFVSDDRCPGDTPLFDPGFENAGAGASLSPTWVLTADDPARGSAKLAVDAATAHSGDVSLSLSVKKPCREPSASTVFTVPEPEATAGPALKFWYRTSHLHAATASSTPGATLPSSESWTQQTICLDPRTAGRPQHLSFKIGASGVCDEPLGHETLHVDDVEATTDASCPAAPLP